MKRTALVLFSLLLGMTATRVHAREVNSFTVSDGQATYTFTLAETAKKLFYHTYEPPDMAYKSNVFRYEAVGPAPFDNEVMRGEIARKVKWLFYNEMVNIDAMHAMALPLGITCFPLNHITDGLSDMALGVKFKTENGVIKGFETADCMRCDVKKSLMDDELAKSGPKGKKRK